MWIAYFLAGGVAYFIGAGMIAAAALAPVPPNWRVARGLVMVTALAGGGLAVLSSTPSPIGLYVLWLGAVVAWLGCSWFQRTARKRLGWGLRSSVVALSVVAVLVEWPHQTAPRLPRAGFEKLYVIGDSISAGIQSPGEHTWPQLFGERRGVNVVNLAVSGATSRSALVRASAVNDASAVVLVEIGGNDLLTGIPAAQFERDLGTLLTALRAPKRLIVMTELPLPPFCNAYGAVQRRVARAQGAVLIPKRYFARVLSVRQATLDGLHLSPAGHGLMADAMWSVLAGLFSAAPPTGR
jgi:acyl-CoA thioesterase-1